jgi:hypothetical protein
MHASIWRFAGDPDDLLARYDAMMGELGAAGMQLHVCLRAPDGIVLVDTCPSKEAFEAFAGGDGFRALRARHGLPDPVELADYPGHIASAGGAVLHSDGVPPLRTG